MEAKRVRSVMFLAHNCCCCCCRSLRCRSGACVLGRLAFSTDTVAASNHDLATRASLEPTVGAACFCLPVLPEPSLRQEINTKNLAYKKTQLFFLSCKFPGTFFMQSFPSKSHNDNGFSIFLPRKSAQPHHDKMFVDERVLLKMYLALSLRLTPRAPPGSDCAQRIASADPADAVLCLVLIIGQFFFGACGRLSFNESEIY